ncbi:MAG: hypothetical protein ABI574_10620 [Burkholderiales bacterium]
MTRAVQDFGRVVSTSWKERDEDTRKLMGLGIFTALVLFVVFVL